MLCFWQVLLPAPCFSLNPSTAVRANENAARPFQPLREVACHMNSRVLGWSSRHPYPIASATRRRNVHAFAPRLQLNPTCLVYSEARCEIANTTAHHASPQAESIRRHAHEGSREAGWFSHSFATHATRICKRTSRQGRIYSSQVRPSSSVGTINTRPLISRQIKSVSRQKEEP